MLPAQLHTFLSLSPFTEVLQESSRVRAESGGETLSRTCSGMVKRVVALSLLAPPPLPSSHSLMFSRPFYPLPVPLSSFLSYSLPFYCLSYSLYCLSYSLYCLSCFLYHPPLSALSTVSVSRTLYPLPPSCLSHNIQSVVDCGALDALVICLEEFDPGVKESAAWALGYIARHNGGTCDNGYL